MRRRVGGLVAAGLAVSVVSTVTAVTVLAVPAEALVPPGQGPGGATARPDLDRHIASALPQRLRDPRLGWDVAIQVRAADGTVLFSSRAADPQLPASNMKLVTAFGALTTLGPDAVLVTRVEAAGDRLLLVGGGDPLLASRGIDRLAARTAANLADRTDRVDRTDRFRVYVNDRYFRDPTPAPGWRSTYVPGEVTYVRSLGRHGVLAEDTAADAGRYYVSRLRAHGVDAVYSGRSAAVGAQVAQVSHTVGQALSVMLADSDNQVAETLFRHVALARSLPATWAGGSRAARLVLEEHGIATTGLRLKDGSGLSRGDRLTPAVLARLLTVVQSGEVPALDPLVSWLPVSGRSGTLSAALGRYTTRPSKCAVGLVHAKTGTLTGALALSGTAVGYDGDSRSFSIIVNHPPTSRYSALTVRRAMDGLAATVTGCW